MKSIFHNISDREQEKLFKLLETSILSYKKNTKIPINPKENLIAIILSGEAHITRTDYDGNRTIIEELEEGSVFGTIISSLNNDEYDIITKQDTQILTIDYFHIINQQKSFHNYYLQFIKNLLEITTNIIEEKNERIAILTKKTIREKLLEYFNIRTKKYGSRIIYLPFSYTDLADYLSIDRSAMMRELKYLKEEGFIETKGRKILLSFLSS